MGMIETVCRRCGRKNPSCGGYVDVRGFFFCKDCDDKYRKDVKEK